MYVRGTGAPLRLAARQRRDLSCGAGRGGSQGAGPCAQPNSRRFTLDEALSIHEASLKRFGELPGLRDEGLLRSALAQPFQTFGGSELYPAFAEKAARYAYGIARNHPFLDGNKRAATACMGAFLRINGFSFKPAADELLETMLGVAVGTVCYEELAEWASRNL
ncbi:MAG: type II toxin-antitoxin system death-on-curing family toxin [Atopobiaceae bacterium]|nr:type II toxin-antitoxin system death-on-curing family toxin [Atopobiaceae bacterium]